MGAPKKKLAIPALDSVVQRPLFKAPEPRDGESEEALQARTEAYQEVEGVMLRVRLIGAERANHFRMRAMRIRHDERARRKADGVPVVVEAESDEDQPQDELAEMEWGDLTRDLCEELLAGIDGVLVGEQDSEGLEDPKDLLRLLDLAGWRSTAALVCLNAQAPDIKSVFC